MGIRNVSSVIKLTNISDIEKTVRELLAEIQMEKHPFEMGFSACVCGLARNNDECPAEEDDVVCDMQCLKDQGLVRQAWDYVEENCSSLRTVVAPGESISLTVKEGSEDGQDGLTFHEADGLEHYSSESVELTLFTADYD